MRTFDITYIHTDDKTEMKVTMHAENFNTALNKLKELDPKAVIVKSKNKEMKL